MNARLLTWGASAAVLIVASHVGCTPARSDDVRVELSPLCPVAGGGTETGAAIAGMAIAVGEAVAAPLLQAAAQAARAAGEGHSTPAVSGSVADHFFLTDGQGHLRANRGKWGCLRVVVQDLRATQASQATERPAGAHDDFDGFRVYLEAAILISPDGQALELQPRTLRYKAPAESSLLGSTARDLSFRIAFSGPGVAQPFAATTLDFKSLVPGPSQWGLQALGSPFPKRSGWLPAPTVDDAARRTLALEATRAARATKPGPGHDAPAAPEPTKQVKTTITVSIVETREGSAVWKFIADTLDGLLPSARHSGNEPTPANAPPRPAG